MPEGINETWRAALIAAARRDLETRSRLAATGAQFDGYNAAMEAVHLENAALLDQAFDEIGWPGRHVIEEDGAGAAFLILQHAISRPALQRRGLEMLIEAIALGHANPLDAAYLADRIAMYEGRGQLFGTQFDWDAEGLLSPAPLADPERVDARRADLGLPPLNLAIAETRARAAAEGQIPPPDLVERRAALETWARRVGWRA